ncbi:hypothetical protein Tco_0814694 [Tanacetum coccineum]
MTNPHDPTYHPQYQNLINQPYLNSVNQLTSPSPQQPYLPPLVALPQHPELHQPVTGNGYQQKDKIKEKLDKTEYEIGKSTKI